MLHCTLAHTPCVHSTIQQVVLHEPGWYCIYLEAEMHCICLFFEAGKFKPHVQYDSHAAVHCVAAQSGLPRAMQEALKFPGIKDMTIGTWCLGPNPVCNFGRLNMCVKCGETVGKRICFSCPFRISIKDNRHPRYATQPRPLVVVAVACSEACAAGDGTLHMVFMQESSLVLDMQGNKQALPNLGPGVLVPLAPFSMGDTTGGWYWQDVQVQQQVVRQLVPWDQLSTEQRKKLKQHLLKDLVPRQGWSKAQELEAIVGAHAPVELRDLVEEMRQAHAL
jgi:hypothetical protein